MIERFKLKELWAKFVTEHGLRKLNEALDSGQVFSAPKLQSLQDNYSCDEYHQLIIDHQP
jgi:hypothetical protein